MPPKEKISKEMVLSAAYDIARENGAELINARNVAARLSCSTQPVMYQFNTINELKKAVYEKADAYHTEYITNIKGHDPFMEIGLNYIRFAVEEKNLFRLLFMSDGMSSASLQEILEHPSLDPVYSAMQQNIDTDRSTAVTIFRRVYLYVHGCACMLAGNSIEYNEEEMSKELSRVFCGAVYIAGCAKQN